MFKLDAGNVLLKPSQRKQLMTWFRRSLRLGQRLGEFVLTITLQRTGRCYVVQAKVNHSGGQFDLKARQTDWRDAIRDVARMLSLQLHNQRLQHALA